ncbi:hypothetical protein Q9L58_010881, partial [Maublancomyces gigas]
MERPVSATFSNDGKLLALGNDEGELALLDWPSGRVRWHRSLADPGAYAIDLGFTSDAHALVVCCGSGAPPSNGAVVLLNADTGDVVRSTPGNGTALAVSPDGRSVALLNRDRLQVLSLPDLKPLWEAPALLGAGPNVEPVGFRTHSTLLHSVDNDWYFVNTHRQLLHAREGSHDSVLVPTLGRALLVEQHFGPPAWVSESHLNINGQSIALPAPLTAEPPQVALSGNGRWLLLSN